MPEQVPVQVARGRNRILRELAARKKQEFMRSFIGRELEAITLTHGDVEFTEALTDNYLKLWLHGRLESNQRLQGRIRSAESDVLIGSVAAVA